MNSKATRMMTKRHRASISRPFSFAFLLALFTIAWLQVFCHQTTLRAQSDTTTAIDPTTLFNKANEIEALRETHSKTFAGLDGYYYKLVSAAPLHYRDDAGRFEEIDPHFRSLNSDRSEFGITGGLYRSRVKKINSAETAVRFESQGGQFFEIQPQTMAYYHPASRRVAKLESARFGSPTPEKNTLIFSEVFAGVNLNYVNETTRFKEEIHLSESFRKKLPSPLDYGIPVNQAYLVFISKVTLDTMLSAYVEGASISGTRLPAGFKRIDYEGQKRIDFKTRSGRLAFHMPPDVAFRNYLGPADTEKETLLRRFYVEGQDLMMITGVPYAWLTRQTSGTVILDPQWEIDDPGSVEIASILNGSSEIVDVSNWFFLAGSSSYYRRSLLRFDLTNIQLPVPDTTHIVAATCFINYWSKSGSGSYVRPVQVHELLQDWDSNATWFQRNAQYNWTTPGIGIDNIDARSVPEALWEIPSNPSNFTWMNFDITQLAKKWLASPASNHGMLLWATNENDFSDGEHRAFVSADPSLRPHLIIKYQFGEVARYSYNADGSLANITFGRDLVSNDYTYNDRGLIDEIEYTTQTPSGNTTIFKEDIAGYDLAGNLTGITTQGPLGNDVTSYNYDNVGRLTSGTSSAYGNTTFSYDRNGNLTQKVIDGQTMNYDYTNPNLNPPAKNSNRVYAVNGMTFRHDAVGNQQRKGGNTMTFDWRRQMESFMGPVSEFYAYNADNWRVQKTEGLIRSGTAPLIDSWRLDVTGAIESALPLAGSTMYRLEVTTNPASGNHRTDSAVKIAAGLSIPVTQSTSLAYSIRAKDASVMRATVQVKLVDQYGEYFSWSENLYDHDGRSNKWNTDLNSLYNNNWYTRVISFNGSELAQGKTITEVFIYANDSPDITTGSQTFVFYVDEIRINGLDLGQVNGETGITAPGYYLEDFDDQNIDDARPTNWYRNVGGNWDATGGTLNSTSFDATLASHQEFSFDNFTAEFDVKVTEYQTTQDWVAFSFRRDTPQAWWDEEGYTVWYRQNGEVQLYRATDIILSTVQTNKDLSVWRHVKIEALADRIKVYVDSENFIDREETSLFDGGFVAFFSAGVKAKFDNLKISTFGEQQRTSYIYSGDVPIAEHDANGNLLAEYVYANGQRIAKLNPDGTTNYYLLDHLGSARALFGSNWNANYYAFGEVAEQSGSEVENRYTYTGKECDCSTGLRYYGWRYYDPQLGRWLTTDPEIQGWSPYAYAGNNPVVLVDADGRLWFVPILIGVGIGAIGGGVYAHNTGGEWWQGALAGAVVGGSFGYFMGAAAGATPLLGSATANWAIAGAGLGTYKGMYEAAGGTTSWANVWKYGVTGAITGATIGYGIESGMFASVNASQSSAFSWGNVGRSALFWGGTYASLNTMEFTGSPTRDYWEAMAKGAFAGGISGAVGSAYVQGTNTLMGSYSRGWLLRTAAYLAVNANSLSQSPDGKEHSLLGIFDVATVGKLNMPALNELGSILLLDDALQTTPTKILRSDPRSGYGSPINYYFRMNLCRHRPWIARNCR